MKTNLNLVSKEISKRLIDKGFDYEVEYLYNDDGSLEKLSDYTNDYNGKLPAPQAEIVLQYLREEHEIDMFLARIGNVTMPNIGYAFIIFYQNEYDPKFLNTPFETAEEAKISAIENVLDYMDGKNNFMKENK